MAEKLVFLSLLLMTTLYPIFCEVVSCGTNTEVVKIFTDLPQLSVRPHYDTELVLLSKFGTFITCKNQSCFMTLQ
jgi:hypothetical protein